MKTVAGKACLALVLNAHLPFVRKPEYPSFLEERWYFEAMSETYLPLLRLFRQLESDTVPFRLSMVLSPTLTAMMADRLLGERYASYLASQIRLGEQEQARTSGDPVFGPLAALYLDLYRKDLDDFENFYARDVLAGFDFFYKKGRIELLTSGATHAFLPLYRDHPEAVIAQIETAIVAHRSAFGKHPAGCWLPQLGWYPGLGELLRAYNLSYTVVTTRGALLGQPTPEFGSFSPVRSTSGLSVFIRDAGATKAVWSEEEGYPADPVYRDFYRDIGFDLPPDYVRPYLGSDQVRGYTGFKYWAVTGRTDQKMPYRPADAAEKARAHARSFLTDRRAAARSASAWMDRPPVMVCPYDAELFGHWWFEGPLFLEALFREAASGESRGTLDLVTLAEYLDLTDDLPGGLPVSEPEYSSWAEGGYGEVWLDGSNDWVHRHGHKMIDRMVELAERFPNESGLRERILNQGAREVLLAMCSDWSMLMRSGASAVFARAQVEDALANFTRIYEMLSANTVDTEWLTTLEKRNNLFPGINYRMFRPKR